MATRQGDDGKGFLSRWSQRKRAAEEEALDAKAAPQPDAPETEADPEAAIDPKDLPDIDSLDADSDYSVFMKEGVPPGLKRKALNKLWQTDPAFREICMLDDYNLDYTDAAMVVPNLKTLFQVGRGMVLPEEEAAAAAEKADNLDESAVPEVAAETLPAAGEAQEGESGQGSKATPGEAPESPRKPRLPGTPLVSGPAERSPAGRASAAPRGERSALQRRWGDPGKG